jgi:soluble lytic murein transglycosylase
MPPFISIAVYNSSYRSHQTLQASRLVNDFVSELPKEDRSALAYWLAHDLQWHAQSVYLSHHDELSHQLSLRFPLAYQKTITSHAKNTNIPAPLIYAIIRQESTFHEDATSTAGARGLMQLMPGTALAVSKMKKILYTDKNQLYLPPNNIAIGVAYLQELAKRFDRHPVLMVAAYNAGPKQTLSWLKNNPNSDIDLWIETLPWSETRNYLKNVVSFYAVYQYRMQESPDLSPWMDTPLPQGKKQGHRAALSLKSIHKVSN